MRKEAPEAQAKDDSKAMPASSFACASGLNTWDFCLPSSQVRNFKTCDSDFYRRSCGESFRISIRANAVGLISLCDPLHLCAKNKIAKCIVRPVDCFDRDGLDGLITRPCVV